MARILHVDDDPILQALTARILERSGHEVVAAGDLPAAWAELTAFGPDLVLLDVELPGGSGLDLLAGIVTSGASVVVVSGFGRERQETS
jgi:DNA-binding response OmpR family regulator